MQDRIKLALAVLLVGSGLVGFYYYPDVSVLYRVLGLLALVIVAAAIAFQTQPGAAALDFGRGALMEVRKVVWPTRKETTQTTLLVLAMVILVGIMLWLFDMFLLWAVRMLTGQGG